jgi:hypothetical protein
MSYIINKSDGSILATVADGQVDQLSSDLTLIGKNYSGFGEALNENLVKLLENFSSVTAPAQPIKGQIWFDVAELKLKVYNGLSFVPVSSATISNTQPATLGVGDLWFNDVDKQLFFYDGTNTILLGPAYSASQGISGLKITNILDSQNASHVIALLYISGVLLGIFSKDSFSPKITISGFTGDIVPGFNAGTLSGIKFQITATNSEKLGNQPAASYLRRDTDNIINGQLAITSNRGLLVGDASQAQIIVVDGNVQFLNDSENKNITIKVKRGTAVDSVIDINSVNQELKFYALNPSSEVTFGGNVTINGNLTVAGDSVTINASTLTVEDKAIELARQSGVTPTDANADGGGVILKGASDHSLLWTIATQAWNSSESMNLATGKTYKIDGVEVITKTSLGPTITSIPGVTSFGTQTRLSVGPVLPTPESGNPPTEYIRIENNTISTIQSNQDLILAPNGAGNVVLGGTPQIKGLGDPNLANDAATKNYVDNTVQSRNLVFSMDISDALSNSGIASYITQIAPPSEYRNGTIARVLCTSISNGSPQLNINSSLNAHQTEFITPDVPGSHVPGGSAFGIDNVSFSIITVPAPVVSVYRTVKIFQLVAGAWTFVS